MVLPECPVGFDMQVGGMQSDSVAAHDPCSLELLTYSLLRDVGGVGTTSADRFWHCADERQQVCRRCPWARRRSM